MKHNTYNTVSVAKRCAKCRRVTQHRNDGVKTGPFLEFIAKLETQHGKPKDEPAENLQTEMFK